MRNRNSHITRTITSEGEEERTTDVVWFNSYGKTVQAEKQRINVTTNYTVVEGTKANQGFRLIFTATAAFMIYVYDSNDAVIDSYQVASTSYPIKLDLIGKLARPMHKLTVDVSKVSGMVFILEEMSTSKKADNYVVDNEGVASMLQQELAIIKGELWYNVNYGLPLLEKIRNKSVIDSKVLEVVTNNEYVRSITTFSSLINNKSYSCAMEVVTIFGNIYISI